MNGVAAGSLVLVLQAALLARGGFSQMVEGAVLTPAQKVTTDSVVVFGSGVGPALGAEEARCFGVFGEVEEEDLVGGVFFQASPDSSYVRVLLCSRGGVLHDTTLFYSSRRLMMIAERIEHWREVLEVEAVGPSPAKIGAWVGAGLGAVAGIVIWYSDVGL